MAKRCAGVKVDILFDILRRKKGMTLKLCRLIGNKEIFLGKIM